MKKSSIKWSGVAVLALVTTSLGVGTPTHASASPSPAAAAAAAPAAPAPLGKAAVGIAREHLTAHAGQLGLSAADVAGLAVSSVVPTAHNGLTNVYLQQRVAGIDVSTAMLNVAVTDQGKVLNVASSAVSSAAKQTNSAKPKITDVAAAQLAAEAVGLEPTSSFASKSDARGPDRARVLGDGGISSAPIPAQLVYEQTQDGDLRLAWELVIEQLDGTHWWQIRMDARTGAELGRTDWVDADSHRVFPMPVESPSFASPVNTRTLVSNPATSASPFGWNDTNGAAGAESTLTLGNNVKAYTDTDANNSPDAASSPDGGAGLAFDFPLDLTTQAPAAYRPAAVSNLYFTNNRIHDVLYRYGFDEASGNFQVNNYGHGGAGTDAVNAEAQDGAGINNANFGTPPDGSPPRMQMFVFNTTVLNRDGDFDNGVIIHEYGHGVSNRLTGGPANVNCLNNQEQAGEGWSDFLSYMLTMPTGTEPVGGRGMGTYVLNQPITGNGVRAQKYSTNMAINTETYDSIKGWGGDEHFVGEVWAEMLWEVTYALIGAHGFSADLNAGPATAGNIMALQLVMDGLKLQPCSPGFVTARNAIIAADQADNGGANKCLLWTAFAKRGLGFSASQGSASSATDGTQAFDVAPSCVAPLAPTVTGSTPSPGAIAVAFTKDANAGITSQTAECVSTDGGATGTQSGAASPLTVGGLTPGNSYHCHVSATNPIGTSAFGPFGDTVQVPPSFTAPGAPVIVSAKALSPKKAKVTFTLASDGGSPVTSYAVTCSGKKGAKTKTKTGPASPITVKGLTPGKKYTCTVKATNAAGAGPASAKSKKFKTPAQAPNGTHHRLAAILGRL